MARPLLTYVLFVSCILLAGCYHDDPWQRGDIEGYAPVYDNSPGINDVSYQQPRKTINGGKLYIAGTVVFQEEADSGLHVISYADPARPEKIGFIHIPGFSIAAVSGDYLCVNNFNDLITIPLKGLSANMSFSRMENVWKVPDFPPTDQSYFECVDPSKGNVIGWRKKIITNPQCRRSYHMYDYPDALKDNGTLRPTGIAVLNGSLFVNAGMKTMSEYALSQTGVLALKQEIKTTALKSADSLFIINDKLAVTDGHSLDLYSATDLRIDRSYQNMATCGKLKNAGDIVYAFPDGSRGCYNSIGLLQYDISKDTTAATQLSFFTTEQANDMVLYSQYLYVATDGGINILDISTTETRRAGVVNSSKYISVVNNGNTLMCAGVNTIDCYDLISRTAPKLLSRINN